MTDTPTAEREAAERIVLIAKHASRPLSHDEHRALLVARAYLAMREALTDAHLVLIMADRSKAWREERDRVCKRIAAALSPSHVPGE